MPRDSQNLGGVLQTHASVSLTHSRPHVAYAHAGDGEAVVFLHGVGGNSSNWRDQISAIGARFHAIAWDARGYGRSEDAEGAWEFSAYAEDLARLLDHLETPAAHVVGLSMGGRIAQEFYLRYPSRTSSLTLCSTFARLDAPIERSDFMRLRRQPLLEGREPRDIAPAIADSLLGSGATSAQRDRLIESLSALRRESYVRALDVLARHELALEPEAIRVPTLLIFGGDDRLTPPSIGREIEKRVAGSRLHVLPEAGHLVNIERPAEFNRILLEFLCRVSQRSLASDLGL